MAPRTPSSLRLLATTALAGLAVYYAPAAQANPEGGQVVGGTANISSAGNTLTVQQTTSRAIINWQSFNIGSGETTQFVQPSSSSIALNRVTGSQTASQIDGMLNANGQVWVINPNGVMFGKDAQVNVAGLLATSSDIDNDQFMAGNYTFNHAGHANASISNAGTITTADAGLVAFVAPNVSNAGVIQAKLGKVQLASGDTFTVDLYGDGLINLQASPAVTEQIVSNSGTIKADGGQILLTAAAAESTVNSLINMSGVAQANSISDHNGEIILSAAGPNSEADVSGTLSAHGNSSGETGGDVTVTANHVALLSGSTIDASGDAGGGYVKVGGDFHGQGATPTASATVVQTGAVINADALTGGNGGQVAVWSDDSTDFAGSISATGANGGAGGFVETSGHATLHVGDTARVSTGGGDWLLDPTDFTIASSGGDITGAALSANLTSGNVTILSSSGGSGTNGDIFVGDTVAPGSGAYSLTLSAYRNITVSDPITLNGGSLILDADNADNSSGYIDVAANLTTNGGNITMGGGSGAITGVVLNADGTVNSAASGFAFGNSGQKYGIFINSATINVGSGNIIANGHGGNNDTPMEYGINNYGTLQTTSGDMAISGTGGDATFASAGSQKGVLNNGGTITTVSGNIRISGTAGNATGSSASSGYGVDLGYGTISSTSTASSGLGSIIIHGAGGPQGAGDNEGVSVTGSVSAAGAADIVINGAGGGSSSWGTDIGTEIDGTVSSTGGNILITGTGGSDTAGSNYGTSIDSSITSTGSGNITINSIAGNGSSAALHASAGTRNIGGGSDSGDITLNQDTATWGSLAIQTSGNVTFAPYSSGTTVGIGSGSGTLSVTDTILGNTTWGGTLTIGDTTNTAAMTINSAYTFPGSVSFVTGSGDITLSHALAFSAAAGSNLEFSSYQNITDSFGGSSYNITSAANALNITFRADNQDNSSGYINIGGGGTINSMGGDITMGGGSGAISAGSGYAWGNSTRATAIYTGATINAGAGNIIMNGNGYNNASGNQNYGILISGGTIETTSGSLSIYGTGGNGLTLNEGILNSSTATITTASGAMILSGTGGTSGTTSSNLDDIGIENEGTISSTGTGAGLGTVTLTGTGADAYADNYGIHNYAGVGIISVKDADLTLNATGGNGTSAGNYGLYNQGTISSTGSGNITLNSVGKNGAASLFNSGTHTIGGGLDSGNITLNQDTAAWGAFLIQTSGDVTFAPYSAGTTVGVGSGSGTLSVTDSVLGNTTWGGLLTIGDTTNTAAMDINSAFTFTDGSVKFVTGSGDITLNHALAFNAAAGKNLEFSSYQNIIDSGGYDITSSANALNITFDADNQDNSSGYIDIAGSVTSKGGDITMGGGSGVIAAGTVNADGTIATPASGFAWGNSGQASGIYLNGFLLNASGGNIVMNGHGYNTTTDNNYGVYNKVVAETTSSGTINITGIGGGSGNSGSDYGIYNETGSFYVSNGRLTLIGTGGGAGSGGSNYGVYGNSWIETIGTGDLFITGQGGDTSGSGTGNYGTYLLAVQATSGGNIIIRGTGGDSSNSNNYGDYLGSYAVTTSGSGNVTVFGTGGGNTNSGNNSGVMLNQYSIETANGQVAVTGIGGGAGTGANNYGVNIQSDHAVTTSGTGDISITGIRGGGDTSSNYGVDAHLFSINDVLQTTGTGSITISTDTLYMSLAGINSVADLTIHPYTAGTTVGVGSGTGTLALTDTDLGYLTWGGTLTIGDGTNTAAMDINSAFTFTDGSVKFVTGSGDITLNHALAFNAVAGKNLIFSSYQNIIDSGGYSITSSANALNMTFRADNQDNNSGYIDLAGNVTSQGGDITMGGGSGAITGVVLNADGTVNTAASGYAWGNAGQAYGIYLNGATVSAGGGDIIMNGHGYDTTTDNNYGVYNYGALGGGNITTTGSGSITISGTGSGNTNSRNDSGVYDDGGTLSAVNGNVIIAGTGGGAGSGVQNYGVYKSGNINLTGNGSLFITATGGDSGGSGGTNVGAYLSGSDALSGSGNIVIRGTGGNSSSGSNDGIYSTAAISNGSGDITLTGTGGGATGAFGSDGINLGGTITNNGTGTLSITGTGGGSGSSANNNGVYTQSGSEIDSVGNGSVIITGQGGNTSGNGDVGVLFYGNILDASGTGTITITGTGGGSGTNSDGISFQNPAPSIYTADGALTVTGTGASGGSGNDDGIHIATGSMKTTGSGNLSVSGVARGGAASYGVLVAVANGLQTTGTGNITVSTDSINLNQANDINSANDLTIHPYTAGTSVGVGSGSGTLSLTDTDLGYLAWGGTLTIGDATNTAAMDINTAHSFSTPASFISGSGYDITLDGQLSTSATGTAFTLASGRNFVNSYGANAFNLTGGGRWLVYSGSPSADTLGGLSAAFTRYSCTYGGACGSFPASGNGFLYRSAYTAPVAGSGGSGSSSVTIPSSVEQQSVVLRSDIAAASANLWHPDTIFVTQSEYDLLDLARLPYPYKWWDGIVPDDIAKLPQWFKLVDPPAQRPMNP